MKTIPTVDLRLWLPLLVAMILIAHYGVWTALQYRHLRDDIHTQRLRHWQENLALLQQEISQKLLAGDPGGAEELLTAYGTDPGVVALALIDGQGKVRFANRFAWKGRPARDTLPGYRPALAARVRQQDRMRPPGLAENHLRAYYPVALTATPGQIRPIRDGLLYLDYDLQPALAGITHTLWLDARLLLLLTLASLGLILLVLKQFVTRPLDTLATHSDRLAGNDFRPAPIRGRGALARLAEAFNRMGRQLQQQLQELAEREQHLHRTLESIGDAVIATDAAGRITRLNPVAERLTGWSTDEALGQPVDRVFVIVNARSRETIPNPVQTVMKTGRVVELANDTTLIARDGHEYQIADSAAPIQGEAGIEGVILVFHDVSEAYRVREERRIAAIALETSNAMLITDADGRILRCNPGFTGLTGFADSELAGRRIDDLLDDIPAEGDFCDTFTRRLQTTGDWRGALALRDRHGQRLHVWLVLTAVRDDAGGITHFVASFSDLSALEEAGRALKASRDKYQTLLDSLHDGVFLIRDGLYVDGNAKLFEILGRPREAVIGQPPGKFSPAGENEPATARARRLMAAVLGGQPQILDWTVQRPDGTRLDVEISAIRIDLEDQPHVLGTVRDISERKQAERERQMLTEQLQGALEEIRKKEELLRLATRAAGIGTWEWDVIADRVAWSDGVAEIFGLDPETFENSYAAYEALLHEDDRERVAAAIRLAIETETPYRIEHRIRWPDGTLRWLACQGEVERNPDGTPSRMYGTVVDVTEHKQAQEEIERLAYFDPLTGLANRRLLLDRLQQAISHARRDDHTGALLFIDLDRFKLLNDSLGHRAGDTLLKEIATRLTNELRDEDTVARLGGDEFVIMLPFLDNDPETAAHQAHRAAEKIRHLLSGGYTLGAHRFHITASLGIAMFPGDGHDAEALLNHADVAMYQAKNNGRDTIAYYHASLQAAADARLAMEEDLRHARQQGELALHYQPQVDADGRPVAVEALLRWRHPERGDVPPNAFIPVAEETGLILPIGDWVLATACRQLRAWQQDGTGREVAMSVNVSPVQFRHAHFVAGVAQILDDTGIDPARLTLEITEGMLIDDLNDTAQKLRELKALGLRLSIDDFGTGYSSLYYLKHLPLDELKIDRAYVQDITEDGNDAAIVETILAMARHLGLEVVAEGVETPEQARFLRDNGCHRYQGYLYARPRPAADCFASLEDGD